jgi:orotidine-5'-phosphate decarboxylase
MRPNRTKLILACDWSDFGAEKRALLRSVAPYIDVVKVGLESMTAENDDDEIGYAMGVTIARLIRAEARDELHKDVMWDMKVCDVKNTVGRALANIVEYGTVSLTTLHATISDEALASAARICQGTGVTPLAVTVLTDLDEEQCMSRFGDRPKQIVLDFLNNAKKHGIRGLVCSPQELSFLRERGALEGITTVIPGIRPAGTAKNDQKRVMTPREAAEAGADYIVVGRPITEAEDPAAAAKAIREELNLANN